MFDELKTLFARPRPFEFYSARDLWTDEHISKQMLAFHLNGDIDVSSRNTAAIERAADWMTSRFDLGKGSRIVDFGCGPGLYASRLARTGATVTGVDFSARSIDYARQAASSEGLDIDYVNQDYLEFEPHSRFDLILMIMCDFCALSPEQRSTILARFRSLLAPGGSVLLDVYSLNAFGRREESASCQPNLMDGFWSPDEYFGFLNTFKYGEEQVVLDKYTIIEADRERTIYNWLQYYDPEDLETEFSRNGLEITEFHADVAGAPFDPDSAEFAVVAQAN